MGKKLKKNNDIVIPPELYVYRDADRKLERVIREILKPCCISGARHMGKTNLLLNAKKHLEDDKNVIVYIDLTNSFANSRNCFRRIIDDIIKTNVKKFKRIADRINLERMERDRTEISPSKEHENELNIILENCDCTVIIFLDEVDALRKAEFSDVLFALIRRIYNIRKVKKVFKRLTYVLSGVIQPSILIKNINRSHSNIAESIYLHDFSHDEFIDFMEKSKVEFSIEVIDSIFSWTKGHPRMTFDLASKLEDVYIEKKVVIKEDVENAVKELYLSNYNIPPLDHIRDLVRSDPLVINALLRIRTGEKISDEIKSKLYLYGVINSFYSPEKIEIKNRIIDESLSEHWLKENMIENKGVSWIVSFLTSAFQWIFPGVRRKKLERLLEKYFNRHEIRMAIENYIPTQYQIVDPASEDESLRMDGFAFRQKLVPFFIKEVFRGKNEEKYYLILADSGMGKTTFMINLFRKCMWKRYNMELIPMGQTDIDKDIDSIENKTDTILLLDAFDEDIGAASDYKARMEDIIDKTYEFKKVIITSRSQFFHSDQDIPSGIGLYKFGGDKREHRFYHLYISPFNNKEIRRFLRKKYPFYRWFKRRKAVNIIKKSPDLMVRPMLLAYIDYLLESEKPYKYTFEIYEEMVRRWIERENVVDKEELRKFSEAIAPHIYENRLARGGFHIDENEIEQFAKKHHIELSKIEMRSRSLLNRDAKGNYKFAHQSILEYMLSLELIRDPSFRYNFNFNQMGQAQRFLEELESLPFFSRPLVGYFTLYIEKSDSVDDKKDTRDDETGGMDIKELNLDEIEKIYRLELDSNRLADITYFSKLKNICRLNLNNNQISDISPLQELKKISHLELEHNQITDISPLRELKNITELRLSNNQIVDITPLRELKNIQRLYLSSNKITDIKPLKELKNLEYLDLSNNEIEDSSIKEELERELGGKLL